MHLGNCLEVMAGMEADSVDAIVTDPPYGLEFMGKEWDKPKPSWDKRGQGEERGFKGKKRAPVAGFSKYVAGVDFQLWAEEWATAALRVLKPAHYLLAFGGTRTHHRLMVALEDAGFEIRDCLMWLYGSGFPKGKGQLKPAYEPIILCRKPGGKVRELGIEECRIETDGTPRKGSGNRVGNMGWGTGNPNGNVYTSGRWPANIVLDEEAGAMLDEMSGPCKTGAISPGQCKFGGIFGNGKPVMAAKEADSGGASRFFYCSKAPRNERWGLLRCNCQTVKLLAWGKQDRNQPEATVATSPPRAISEGALTDGCDCSMTLCGSRPTDQSRPVAAYITSTETNSTTESRTCNSSQTRNTSASTAGANSAMGSGGNLAMYAGNSSPSPKNTGISPAKAGRCTGVVGPVTSLRSLQTSVCEDCGAPLELVAHPTQKPVALMRWLVRLIGPPGGTVLDPFMGSGTTGVACVTEGREFIGIELDPDYHRIAQARIAHAEQRQLEMVS